MEEADHREAWDTVKIVAWFYDAKSLRHQVAKELWEKSRVKITVCGDKKGGKISLGLENARVRQALPNTVAAKWEDN